MAKENYTTEVKLIGPFVASFPTLFKPSEKTGKYGVDALYEDGSQVHKQLLALEQEAVKNRWGSKEPHKLLRAVRDGNNDRVTPLDSYEGKYFSKLQTNRAPAVTGPDNEPINDPMQINGGDICVALVSAYPYDNADKPNIASNRKGIYLILHGIRKLRDGAPLDGGVKEVDTSALREYDASNEAEDF